MSTQTMDLDKLASLSDEELEKTTSLEIPTAPVVEENKKDETPAVEDKTDEEIEETPPVIEEKKPEVDPKKPVETEKKDETVPPKTEETPPVAPKLADPAKKDGPDAFAEAEAQKKAAETAQAAQQAGEKKPEDAKDPKADPAAAQAQKVAEAAPSVIDYKAGYERIMAPFKANGKEIKLQSIEEAVQLMQMGANYTKKMQELQSVRKYVMMLQNAGLLDEGKLGFLIDLDKKDPEAIKKFLVDAKVDPVELDLTKVQYKNTGSHAVSDQEVALQTTIEDLNGQEGGKETLQSVHGWDPASKKVLWENPDILRKIHEQRLNGVHAKITAEMDRKQALGQIPPSTPFLAAYKAIGDELQARGAFGTVTQPVAPGSQTPVSGAPVAVRPAPVKTPGTKVDDKQVKAAAPTRTTPRTVTPLTNYLAMSDEEILKTPPPKF